MLQVTRIALARASARQVTRPVPSTGPSLVRWNSSKKNNVKDSGPKSLLTDDILQRAGIDLEAGKDPKDKQPDTALEGEGEREAETLEDQRARWKGTARKSADQSSTALKREKRGNLVYIGLLAAVLGGALFCGRDLDEDEARRHTDIAATGYAPGEVFARIKARFNDTFGVFSEPVFEKLLPDPLPEPYGRPLTLVLGLDDVLIHSEWTREHGWRTAKRPGLDYFLGYLAQYYEVVVFSDKYMVYSEKVVSKLDPYHTSISHALFREAARYQNGKIIKDVSNLNRDPAKVISVDCDPDAVSLQPENAVILKPWSGDPNDKDLVRLIPFLEWVATQPVKDVRPILKTFAGTNVPEEYARREALARARFEAEWHEKHGSNSSGNWAAKLLGVATPTPQVPKMPQDYIREEGQKGYEAFQKYLAENGEKMLVEEKQREQEFLNAQKFTLNKLMTSGMPTQEEVLAAQQRMEKERAQ